MPVTAIGHCQACDDVVFCVDAPDLVRARP
jgi:hypothetical protein